MSCEAWDDYCDRINDTNEEIQDRIEYHTQCLAKWQCLEKEFNMMDPKEDIDKFLEFYHKHIYCRRGQN